MRQRKLFTMVVTSVLLTGCAEPSFEQSSANFEQTFGALVGDNGTVRFPLDSVGQSFELRCDGASAFCGLTLEMGLIPTDFDFEAEEEPESPELYGVTLETYGPQSFNGDEDEAPSYSTDVPGADLVEASQRIGSISVAHQGTVRFKLHDPWDLLRGGDLTGLDVQLRFPRCDGGRSFCD